MIDSFPAKYWMVSRNVPRVNVSDCESPQTEGRPVNLDATIRPLVIHFAHGKTVTLKRMQEAVWIPSAL